MIQTQFFILTSEQYETFKDESSAAGVSLDYFLLEFCHVEGDWVSVEN
jgi:hypothetical protein